MRIRSFHLARLIGCSLLLAGATALAGAWILSARHSSAADSCANHLRELGSVKQQWALEHKTKSTDIPKWDDVRPYLRKIPRCPQGGTYSLGPAVESPHCSYPGHNLDHGIVLVANERGLVVAAADVILRRNSTVVNRQTTSGYGETRIYDFHSGDLVEISKAGYLSELF